MGKRFWGYESTPIFKFPINEEIKMKYIGLETLDFNGKSEAKEFMKVEIIKDTGNKTVLINKVFPIAKLMENYAEGTIFSIEHTGYKNKDGKKYFECVIDVIKGVEISEDEKPEKGTKKKAR